MAYYAVHYRLKSDPKAAEKVVPIESDDIPSKEAIRKLIVVHLGDDFVEDSLKIVGHPGWNYDDVNRLGRVYKLPPT